MDKLSACPLCGSPDVELDCYSRDGAGACTEPAVNCNGCGLIAIFDFTAAEPWEEITKRWNTRATLSGSSRP